jgi:hypothetical protein
VFSSSSLLAAILCFDWNGLSRAVLVCKRNRLRRIGNEATGRDNAQKKWKREEEEEEEVLDLDQRASERAFYIVNGCAQNFF